jgi:hypothetical protein
VLPADVQLMGRLAFWVERVMTLNLVSPSARDPRSCHQRLNRAITAEPVPSGAHIVAAPSGRIGLARPKPSRGRRRSSIDLNLQ